MGSKPPSYEENIEWIRLKRGDKVANQIQNERNNLMYLENQYHRLEFRLGVLKEMITFLEEIINNCEV